MTDVDALRILVAGNCPGAAEGLLPVRAALLDAGASVRVLGVRSDGSQARRYHGSAAVFERTGIPFEDVPAVAAPELREMAGGEITACRPHLVLVGTSHDPTGLHFGLEEAVIAAARAAGIPAVQFADSREVWHPRRDEECWPDRLMVPDTVTRDIVLERSRFPGARIEITGNPAWDAVAFKVPGDREALRDRLGIAEGQRLIVYFTGVDELAGNDRETLSWVLRALHPDDRLVVRPHPRDGRDYREILAGAEHRLVATDLASDDLLECASICVVHGGAMGLKAMLRGVATFGLSCPYRLPPLSGDPGCNPCRGFPEPLSGGSCSVDSEAAFRRAFDRPRQSDVAGVKKMLHLDGRSAERIARICIRLVKHQEEPR
jgi:hypothetical protein